jgi:hypothetical protein
MESERITSSSTSEPEPCAFFCELRRLPTFDLIRIACTIPPNLVSRVQAERLLAAIGITNRHIIHKVTHRHIYFMVQGRVIAPTRVSLLTPFLKAPVLFSQVPRPCDKHLLLLPPPPSLPNTNIQLQAHPPTHTLSTPAASAGRDLFATLARPSPTAAGTLAAPGTPRSQLETRLKAL